MYKKVICRKCGYEIAQEEKHCPYCRAYRPPILRYPLQCLTLIAVAIAALILIELYFAPDNSQASAKQALPIPVTAADLYSAYSDNEIKADETYRGKTVCVTGVILEIGRDVISDAPCISLDSGDDFGFYPIQCFFPKGNEHGLSELSKGQIISIIGRCTGIAIQCVQLSDCSLRSN